MRICSILSSKVAARVIPSATPTACVCIIGVGYVGASLLVEFASRFLTIGYDVSEKRIQVLRAQFASPRILLTTDPTVLGRGTHFLIAVPTPLKGTTPDLMPLAAAIETVLQYASVGSSIVIESSVPVGTTRQLLWPHRHAFHCGMSPERIDPGRQTPSAREIPKVVAGLGPKALRQIAALYGAVYETIVTVSKPEVAEMMKLYENCYRMVNIAYVNEVSDACRYHGIDPNEMIGAAATKPFGFQPFYPGLGVGGHCIPVNPFYLLHNNRRMKVLELATHLMLNRPTQLAGRFHRLCLSAARVQDARARPRVLLVGLGFKVGQTDTDGSPAVAFGQRLSELGCERLAFFDPSRTRNDFGWMEQLHLEQWDAAYIDGGFDGVAVCNRQSHIDLTLLDGLHKALVRRYF